MKKIVLFLVVVLTVSTVNVMAGNEDRIGAAGGTQLLLNP